MGAISKETLNELRSGRPDPLKIRGALSGPLQSVLESPQFQATMGYMQLGSDVMSELVSGPMREIDSLERFSDFIKAAGAGYGTEHGIVPSQAMQDLAAQPQDPSLFSESEIERRAVREQALSMLPPDASMREQINVSAQALRDYHGVRWYEEMGLGVIPELIATPLVGPLATSGRLLSSTARAARAPLYRTVREAGASPGFARFATQAATSPFVGAGRALEVPLAAVRKSDEAFMAGAKAPYRTARGTYLLGSPDDLVRDPVEQAMRSAGRSIDPRVGKGIERGVEGMHIDPATGWRRAPLMAPRITPASAMPSPEQGIAPYGQELTPVEVDEILTPDEVMGTRGETLIGVPRGGIADVFPEGTTNAYHHAPWLGEGRFRNVINEGLEEDLSSVDFVQLRDIEDIVRNTGDPSDKDVNDLTDIISQLSPMTMEGRDVPYLGGIRGLTGVSYTDIENSILAGRFDDWSPEFDSGIYQDGGMSIANLYVERFLNPDGAMSIRAESPSEFWIGRGESSSSPLISYLRMLRETELLDANDGIAINTLGDLDNWWRALNDNAHEEFDYVNALFRGDWGRYLDTDEVQNMIQNANYGDREFNSFRSFIESRHGPMKGVSEEPIDSLTEELLAAGHEGLEQTRQAFERAIASGDPRVEDWTRQAREEWEREAAAYEGMRQEALQDDPTSWEREAYEFSRLFDPNAQRRSQNDITNISSTRMYETIHLMDVVQGNVDHRIDPLMSSAMLRMSPITGRTLVPGDYPMVIYDVVPIYNRNTINELSNNMDIRKDPNKMKESIDPETGQTAEQLPLSLPGFGDRLPSDLHMYGSSNPHIARGGMQLPPSMYLELFEKLYGDILPSNPNYRYGELTEKGQVGSPTYSKDEYIIHNDMAQGQTPAPLTDHVTQINTASFFRYVDRPDKISNLDDSRITEQDRAAMSAITEFLSEHVGINLPKKYTPLRGQQAEAPAIFRLQAILPPNNTQEGELLDIFGTEYFPTQYTDGHREGVSDFGGSFSVDSNSGIYLNTEIDKTIQHYRDILKRINRGESIELTDSEKELMEALDKIVLSSPDNINEGLDRAIAEGVQLRDLSPDSNKGGRDFVRSAEYRERIFGESGIYRGDVARLRQSMIDGTMRDLPPSHTPDSLIEDMKEGIQDIPLYSTEPQTPYRTIEDVTQGVRAPESRLYARNVGTRMAEDGSTPTFPQIEQPIISTGKPALHFRINGITIKVTTVRGYLTGGRDAFMIDMFLLDSASEMFVAGAGLRDMARDSAILRGRSPLTQSEGRYSIELNQQQELRAVDDFVEALQEANPEMGVIAFPTGRDQMRAYSHSFSIVPGQRYVEGTTGIGRFIDEDTLRKIADDHEKNSRYRISKEYRTIVEPESLNNIDQASGPILDNDTLLNPYLLDEDFFEVPYSPEISRRFYAIAQELESKAKLKDGLSADFTGVPEDTVARYKDLKVEAVRQIIDEFPDTLLDSLVRRAWMMGRYQETISPMPTQENVESGIASWSVFQGMDVFQVTPETYAVVRNLYNTIENFAKARPDEGWADIEKDIISKTDIQDKYIKEIFDQHRSTLLQLKDESPDIFAGEVLTYLSEVATHVARNAPYGTSDVPPLHTMKLNGSIQPLKLSSEQTAPAVKFTYEGQKINDLPGGRLYSDANYPRDNHVIGTIIDRGAYTEGRSFGQQMMNSRGSYFGVGQNRTSRINPSFYDSGNFFLLYRSPKTRPSSQIDTTENIPLPSGGRWDGDPSLTYGQAAQYYRAHDLRGSQIEEMGTELGRIDPNELALSGEQIRELDATESLIERDVLDLKARGQDPFLEVEEVPDSFPLHFSGQGVPAGEPPLPRTPELGAGGAGRTPPPPRGTTLGPDADDPNYSDPTGSRQTMKDEDAATAHEKINNRLNQEAEEAVEQMGMDNFTRSAEEKARQSENGWILATIDKMGYLPPWLRNIGDLINPAQKMVREGMRRIWVATMVESDAKSWFQTAMPNKRHRVEARLANVFHDPNGTSGEAVMLGEKVTNANYIGGHSYSEDVYRNHNTGRIMNDEERAVLDNMIDERITGTLKDIIENPQLYDLSQEQLDAIAGLSNHHTWAFNRANSLGVELKFWESNPNGAYLPTISSGVPTDTVFSEMAGDIMRVGRTSTYTRYHATLRDRMASEYSQYMTDGSAVFKPELNISTLIEHADNFKVDAVGGEAFSTSAGGRSKMEALEWLARDEVDPKSKSVTRQRIPDARILLAKRKLMQRKIRTLRRELRSVMGRTNRYNAELRESASTIDPETRRSREILDNMLETIGDPDNAIDDMAVLRDIEYLSSVNEQLIGVRWAQKLTADAAARADIEREFRLKELQDAIKEYKSYLDDYNDRGTQLLRKHGQVKVEEGLNKWFTKQEAGTITSIRKGELGRGDGIMDKIYNVMSILNQTKLSGDFSPFMYQLPLAAFFQPVRSGQHFLRLLMHQGRRPGDKYLIQDFINAKKENWDDYIIDKEDMLEEFTQYTNIPIAGAAEKEFRAGLIPIVASRMGTKGSAFGRKYEALNDFMYRMLTRVQIDSYFAQKNALLRAGFDEEAAKVAAGQATQWIVPRLAGQARRVGLSPRRQSLERIPFTSISFVRMPLEFGKEASTGLSKIFFHGATGKRWTDPKNLMNPKAPDAVTGEMTNLLTPSEYAASKMAVNLAGALGAVSIIFGIHDGLSKDMSGAPLLQHALKRSNPADPDFWTVWGGLRIGGPVRSLARQIIPQPMDIGGYKPFGDLPVPYGGLPRFFSGRISPFMRFWQELATQKDWRGNAINVDNGLASQVNFGLWSVGAFTPISVTEFPTFLREEGARAIPEGMPGANILLDEGVEGEAQRYGEADFGQLGKTFARELLGASVVERTPRKERDTRAIAWAQANEKKFKTDSEGRFSFWSLDEVSRAEFMLANKDIAKDLRKETQQLADAGVGTYDKQLELYRTKDNFLMNLDIIDSHIQREEYVTAYKMFREFRDKYYDDRSNIFRQLKLDPEEEPADINSKEYAMWRYNELFDEATLKTDVLTGKERDSSQWTFSPEKFGILLEGLKEEWEVSNTVAENSDGQVVPMWEYVKSQQRLIEMEYPDSVQTMANEVRAINDSGWWDILDSSTLRPLLVAYMGQYGAKFSEEVDVFLEASPEARVDLMRGKNRAKYNFINDTYNTLTRTSVSTQTGGPIGLTKLNFIRQNPEIAQLLYKYDFAFPGKTLMDLNRSSETITSSGVPSHLMEAVR